MGAVRVNQVWRKEGRDTEEEKIRIAREMIRRQDIREVLRENGVPEEEFVRWLEDGELAEYLYRMAKTKAMACVSELWLKLGRMAASGDLKAMKLYYDLCDRCDREKSAEAEEVRGNPEVDAIRKEIFGHE